MDTKKSVSRRTFFSNAGVTVAGLSVLPLLNPIGAEEIQPPFQNPLKTSMAEAMLPGIATFVDLARAKTLTRDDVVGMSAMLTLIHKTWEKDGTWDWIQAQSTQDAMNNCVIDPVGLAKLCTDNGITCQSADFAELADSFSEKMRPHMSSEHVKEHFHRMIKKINGIADRLPASPIAAPIEGAQVEPATICWLGIYAGFAGFFAGVTFEVPPLAALFGGVALIYIVLSFLFC